MAFLHSNYISTDLGIVRMSDLTSECKVSNGVFWVNAEFEERLTTDTIYRVTISDGRELYCTGDTLLHFPANERISLTDVLQNNKAHLRKPFDREWLYPLLRPIHVKWSDHYPIEIGDHPDDSVVDMFANPTANTLPHLLEISTYSLERIHSFLSRLVSRMGWFFIQRLCPYPGAYLACSSREIAEVLQLLFFRFNFHVRIVMTKFPAHRIPRIDLLNNSVLHIPNLTFAFLHIMQFHPSLFIMTVPKLIKYYEEELYLSQIQAMCPGTKVPPPHKRVAPIKPHRWIRHADPLTLFSDPVRVYALASTLSQYCVGSVLSLN